jgi:hypothetical protein
MRDLSYIQSISLHGDTRFNICESNIDCNNWHLYGLMHHV